MSWQFAAWLMLGGSTLLLFAGLPGAFTFIAVNIAGALIWLGGVVGVQQLARSSVVSITSFSLTPIPLFILMGEVLLHTGIGVNGIDGVACIIVRVQLTPSLGPRTPLTEYHGWSRLLPFVQYVVPLVSIFVIVVVSMSAGWATPTESAAIGAFATMLMAIVYRALTVKNLFAALRGTVAISTIILFIILGATTFAQILSFSGASNGLVGQLLGLGLPPMAIVAGMMGMLIFLGIFVDQVSMMLITLPIFMPIVQRIGVEPVWFGVMF